MNTEVTPNQLEKAQQALKNAKLTKFELPETIREDEAHLNHIAVITAVPDMKNLDFRITGKIVKVNDETMAVAATQLPKYGTAIVLHEGKEYLQDKAKGDAKAEKKAEADAVAQQEEVAKKAKENEDLADLVKKQGEELAELRKALDKVNKAPKEEKKAAKEEVKAPEVEADKKEEEKAGNGKG